VPELTAEAVAAAAARVRDRIAAAGGDPERVALVAVTKGHPAEAARLALAAGLADLGESYAQELSAKADALALDPVPGAPAPRWHAIGRIQRNKVRVFAPHTSLWQSVDRLSVGEEISRRAPGAAVLVQVNVTGEETKGGCRPETAPGLVEGCRDLGLEVRGLMAIGPTAGPDAAGAAFSALARLADRLGLAERSMGMSDDLEAAVAAGTTMVRVGTALFGPRARAREVGH
jgi:PLP dependent protein